MKVLFLQLAIAVLCVVQSQARGYNRRNQYRRGVSEYNDIGLGESGRRAKEIMGKRVLASVIGILDQLKDIVHDSSLVSTQVCHLEMTMNITGDQALMGTPRFSCRYVQDDEEDQDNKIDQVQDPIQDPIPVQDPVPDPVQDPDTIPVPDPVPVPDPDQDLDQDQGLYEDRDEGLIPDDFDAESSPDDLEKPKDDSLWSWRNRYGRRYRGRK